MYAFSLLVFFLGSSVCDMGMESTLYSHAENHGWFDEGLDAVFCGWCRHSGLD